MASDSRAPARKLIVKVAALAALAACMGTIPFADDEPRRPAAAEGGRRSLSSSGVGHPGTTVERVERRLEGSSPPPPHADDAASAPSGAAGGGSIEMCRLGVPCHLRRSATVAILGVTGVMIRRRFAIESKLLLFVIWVASLGKIGSIFHVQHSGMLPNYSGLSPSEISGGDLIQPPTAGDAQSVWGGADREEHRRAVVLTSWYTFNSDPIRPVVQVQPDDIEYIHSLYVTAAYHRVPLVIFHDSLTDEFVRRYTNEYVTFERAAPHVGMSTNDFRFFPYLEYVKEHELDLVLMVDGSDVWFNSNPFAYLKEHEGPDDQLFISTDVGRFNRGSWMTEKCYGDDAYDWPSDNIHYNAGVWGGTGRAVRCLLECMTREFLKFEGTGKNCNMPTLNYCVHIDESCKPFAPVHKNPKFVNPFGQQCAHKEIPIIHNKCKGMVFMTRVDIDEETGENVLTEVKGGQAWKWMERRNKIRKRKDWQRAKAKKEAGMK